MTVATFIYLKWASSNKISKKLREYSGNKPQVFWTKFKQWQQLHSGKCAGLPIQRYRVQTHKVPPGSTGPFNLLKSIQWVPETSSDMKVKFSSCSGPEHRGRWTLTLKDHIFLDGVKNDLLWSSKRLFKKSNSTTFFEI